MKSRRGISTVIGAIFFIIIFTTTISYVTYNMNLLSNFANSIVTKNQADADANHESFQISKATTSNNQFNIIVQNTGNIALNITRLYILNKTDVSWGTHKYFINQVVYPGHPSPNLAQGLSLIAKAGQGYDIKLVTTRGNTKEFFVNSASQEPLFMQLYTLPSSGPTNFNTTLLYAVTNNMTNGGMLTNVQPIMTPTNTTAQAVMLSGPTPTSYPLLPTGDTAFFQWKYKITGSSGQTANFKASLMNPFLNNNVSQNVTITNPTYGTNIGHGGKGVYASTVNSIIQFRNITSAPANHIIVTANTTDILLDTSSTLTETGEAPIGGGPTGSSTTPGASLRWYQFITMPNTEKFYLIT
jgi:hypothetical protein